MASTSISPTYLSSLFPGGLPSASATTTQAPLAAAYQAQVTPATANTVDTSGLGANQLVQQILGVMQPQFQQQQQALTNNLANAGIVGGSTGGAVTDLGNQQTQQLAGALAPYEQTAQQMLLGANEYNSGVLNNTSQFNAGANNANSQFNANTLNNNSQFNAGNILNANNTNANILNQNSQYNTTNSLNAGQYDAGTANTILGQLLGYQNQDYLQNLNNQLSLAQDQQSGQTGAFQPIYQQASAPNFSGLAGAFGSNATGGSGNAAAGSVADTGSLIGASPIV